MSIAAASAAGQSPSRVPLQLKSVLVRPSDGSIQVTFRLSGAVRYKAARTADPSRIVIDLLQTGISPVFTKREILTVHAALVRVLITRAAGSTRAVLDLGAAGSHSVYVAADELIVEIKTARPAVNARATPAPLPASSLPATGFTAPAVAPQTASLTIDDASDAGLKIPWVPLAPKIDDFISPGNRPVAARVNTFRQREPGDGNPVSEETIAYLSYDSEYLYAAFVCRDESGGVRKHIVGRDSIGEDDQVALYLDTFRDGRHAYVFASNPFGVQQDGVISDGDDASYTADMVWRSDARLTPDGFAVLIAIPFKTLRFPGGWVQNWRFAVGRTIARRGESAYWPPISRRISGFVRQMAALDGLELISPGRNVQVTPFGSFARARSFDQDTRVNTLTERRQGGVDAKVVVKNAVTIDATVNPEFSDVESDDPLVDVNQRFELFRPEKRPFFMENVVLFETPITLLFTRRIVDPAAGVRLTARSAGWAVGGLMADDRGVGPAAAAGFWGGGAAVGAARVQRLVGERSNVGVLATQRDDGRARNRVVSADARFQMTPAWSFAGQAVRSDDRGETGERHIGAAYLASLSRTGPNFTYVGSYRDIGSALRVPLGFVPRRDLRAAEQYAGYVWRIGNAGVWSFGPAVTTTVDWDGARRLQDRWVSLDIGLSRAGQFDAHVARAEGYELYATIPFATSTTSISISNNARQWLSTWAMYSRGTAINYTPAAGLAPFLGSKQDIYASVTLRPSARLDLGATVLYERFDAGRDGSSSQSLGIFETGLLRAKANLHITRSLAFRSIVDYNQLESESTLFAESGYRRLVGDIVVTYQLHPGTAVYIGLNNRYENVLPDTWLDGPARHRGMPRFPIGQQIFVKLSYLFRF
jgi:hypothetical protein